MGVPAFYRWLSEKYPKVVQDILEERVHLAPNSNMPLPFDATKPNPSGLECDNLYIDMNGIIHPCAHPEQGPQPTTEEEMYDNVCQYVDRLFRAIRPRQLLYLAIDGVAPRAKMNQQRSRRFRSAQEARELRELEDVARDEMIKSGHKAPPPKDAWDSNVITPGTPFMLNLSTYIRFYIRKRISQDKAWKNLRVIFSDASIPGEGEHKIMSHIRLQRALPGYNPNLVHVLHGLDADLIMLALATHEAHFYISRELVTFGRKSQDLHSHRQLESGFQDQQRLIDERAGDLAMELPENKGKPLQRVAIPILREYLAAEFASCLYPRQLPFPPSLERLIDDIVFLCFFVGNDFLPHLPSLDIRDGALDYLFNIYKRLLPSMGDYITKSGGNVNLSHVDVILAEVGSIEDYVFQMKYEHESRQAALKKSQQKQNNKSKNGAPPVDQQQQQHAQRGRAARLLERDDEKAHEKAGIVALSRGHQAKEQSRHDQKAKHIHFSSPSSSSNKTLLDNAKAALAVKEKLMGTTSTNKSTSGGGEGEGGGESEKETATAESSAETGRNNNGAKRTREEEEEGGAGAEKGDDPASVTKCSSNSGDGVGVVGEALDEFEVDGDNDDGDDDDDDDDDDDKPEIELHVDEQVVDPQVTADFKARVKAKQQKVLDEYTETVEDNVRLHEAGWKDRYYSDKCKADDVSANGGREHLFRSYVVGLCWVMKYYYDGCPSWKWYFPFHYAPFASDLRNIERFAKDIKALELATPFNPVEQLMAVLPSDSSHAIPKASRWLMLDEESPIIDFYPKHVPVDPNGKAMPWLWVVLLPFIDEERLLAAMSPTMAKWKKEELFCNSRGLDDGYLYVNKSHLLSRKLLTVLEGGKTAKSPKVRLTDAAAYGTPGFSGSVRPPLSHEIYPLDEDASIPPPPTANRIDASGIRFESVFASSIEANDALCVAFTEPSKLSHKSVLLPGARVPAPLLTADDKRLRRPRLNRGGDTIANLGMGPRNNGQSFQSGYGSMNIGSYERQLAERTGRSGQMNQPGTRAWGAMEPTPKRARGPPPGVNLPNPFAAQQQQQHPPHYQQQQWSGPQAPPRQQPMYQPHQHGIQYHQEQQHRYPQQQQQYPQQPQWAAGRGGYQYPPNEQGGYQQGGYQQQQGFSGQGGFQQQQQQPHHQQYQQHQHQQQPSNTHTRFNFRSGGPQQYQQQQQGGQGQQPRVRASSDVMKNLKAQLSSTLNNQNRRSRER